MANSYSIEISGSFNAAQLQSAINAAVAKSGKPLSVSVNVDTRQAQQAMENVAKSANKAAENASKINVPEGAVVKTKQIERTTSNIVTNVNKIKVDEQTTVTYVTNRVGKYGQIKSAIKETVVDTEKLLNAEKRENEILDRRLGKLKQTAKLQEGYTKGDVLSQANLPSDATITAAGAFTPVAGRGTWQRYIVSIQEAANRYHNYAVNVNEATGELRKLDTGITATNKALAAQGETLDRLIVKVAKWAALTTLVYLPIRAFKEALVTLKEVDSELVTIQKVTDMSKSRIQGLTQNIYSLASAYGRTADELLRMSSAFARAGFEDNLEQMTELAALTQNVGDLTSDAATQFLLAANAAWKLQGNYESLMAIIDGMNEVTNHSANDFQALSEGISVAGSVFANAGESAQTFTAMLGTVVAATQRSGSEVARGLRTIAMNIRQIKGELEDGEIIDEESISDAAKALNSIGVSVSENGELRKVSDVLTDLAEKWNTLTSAEQSYVASSLAGKRQANVLIALMQNVDEYYKEIENYANGVGSALKENEIYLDSWDAKTKQLKATWTEFVSGVVETDLIKGGLDVAIKAVELLNNKFVQTAIQIGVVTKAIDLLGMKIGLIGASKGFEYLTAGVGVFKAGGGIAAVAEALSGTVLPIMAIVGAVAAIVTIVDKLNVSLEEQKDIIKDLEGEYNSLYGEGSDFADLLAREDELTTKEKARLAVLKQQEERLNAQIKAAKEYSDQIARTEFNKERVMSDRYDYFYAEDETDSRSNVVRQVDAMRQALEDLRKEQNLGIGTSESQAKELAAIVAGYEDMAEVLERNKDNLNEDEEAWLTLYNMILIVYENLLKAKEGTDATSDGLMSLTKRIDKVTEAYTELEKQTGIVSKAENELNEQGYISIETFDVLAQIYPEIISDSQQLANGYKVEKSALGNLIASHKSEAELLQHNARVAAVNYINSISNIKLAVNASTESILNNIEALILQRQELAKWADAQAEEKYAGISPGRYQRAVAGNDASSEIAQLNQLRNALKLSQNNVDLIKTSGASGSTKDTATSDAINDYYNIIKHRIWLSEQRADKYGKQSQEFNDELKEQANYYVGLRQWAEDKAKELRAEGFKDESEEIKRLQEIWWEADNWITEKYRNALEDMQESIKDFLADEKDKLNKSVKEIEAQINDYKQRISDSKEALNDHKEVFDAQIDKLNALIDLEKAYYDVATDIKKEQADILKQLDTAKQSYQYLDEETRKLLFNESDYAELSKKLSDISEDALVLYKNYQMAINGLTEDNIYLADQLTKEFETQYKLKQKEYEIAKAELGLAKSRNNLQNVQQNRNTMMLVDGQFQWVADPKAIREALEEYAEAEQDYNQAIEDAAHERTVAELEVQAQNIKTNEQKLQKEYESAQRAWQDIIDTLERKKDSLTAEYNALEETYTSIINSLADKSENLGTVYNDGATMIIGGTTNISQSLNLLSTVLSGAADEIAQKFGLRVSSNSYSGVTPAGNTVTWTEDENGRAGDVKGVNPIEGSTEYYVGSTDGKNFMDNAAPGATMTGGDGSHWTKNSDGSTTVVYNGVTYDAVKYDSTAMKYATGILNGAVTKTGAAILHGSQAKPEYVLNNDQAYTLLRNLSTAIFDIEGLRRVMGSNGGISHVSGEMSNIDSHDIVVNGMKITGSNADKFAEVARQIIPLYAG